MAEPRLFIPEVWSVIEARENGPLLAAAADLWIKPRDLVMDVTYGEGNFWTQYLPERFIVHDRRLDGVDFRRLPEDDRSIDVVVFDPPYISQGGRETSTASAFLDRYGLADAPRTDRELRELFGAGLKETQRVLKPGGRLLVKCMDFVSGGHLVTMRHHVVQQLANELGLRQEDEFVHYSGPGPGNKRPGRQKHSRRAHTFLLVFVAPKRPRKALT